MARRVQLAIGEVVENFPRKSGPDPEPLPRPCPTAAVRLLECCVFAGPEIGNAVAAV